MKIKWTDWATLHLRSCPYRKIKDQKTGGQGSYYFFLPVTFITISLINSHSRSRSDKKNVSLFCDLPCVLPNHPTVLCFMYFYLIYSTGCAVTGLWSSRWKFSSASQRGDISPARQHTSLYFAALEKIIFFHKSRLFSSNQHLIKSDELMVIPPTPVNLRVFFGESSPAAILHERPNIINIQIQIVLCSLFTGKGKEKEHIKDSEPLGAKRMTNVGSVRRKLQHYAIWRATH